MGSLDKQNKWRPQHVKIRSRPSMWLLYVWRKSKREGGTGRGSGEMQEVKKKIRKVEQRRECEVDVVGMEMGE